jgi:hypothetical protein
MMSDKNIPQPLTDEEVRVIIVESMAAAEMDPAIIYAFHTTGVYVCDDNIAHLSEKQLSAWHAAIDEYQRGLSLVQ